MTEIKINNNYENIIGNMPNQIKLDENGYGVLQNYKPNSNSNFCFIDKNGCLKFGIPTIENIFANSISYKIFSGKNQLLSDNYIMATDDSVSPDLKEDAKDNKEDLRQDLIANIQELKQKIDEIELILKKI